MSQHADRGREPARAAAASRSDVVPPSQHLAWFGLEREPERLRWFSAGRLAFAFHEGSLRYIRLGEREVLRGINYVVRDHNWGNYPSRVGEPRVSEGPEGLAIEFDAACRHPGCDLDWHARIEVSRDRRLAYTVTATMREDFRTNRIGFAVLHPAALAGQPAAVEHVDGRVSASRFPELISPHQPFFDMRAISHEVAPGLRATCTMTGETFEMEDQRQWSDASFKTYCRPLSKPFPFVIPKGESVTQAVTLTLEGEVGEAVRDAAAGPATEPVPATLDTGRQGGRLPEIGMGAYPHRLEAPAEAVERFAALRPAHLMLEVEPASGTLERDLGRFRELAERAGSRPVLDVVTGSADDAPAGLPRVAEACRAAGVAPEAVLVHPATPATLAAGREAFPGARVGGGHNAFFTELNRNRPPEGIDFARWTTNPTYHADDDLSAMETLATLPVIVRTARSFCHGAPLWCGPSTMRMRFNPNATEAVGIRRMADGTPETVDARQRGLFGSAWLLASTARWAKSGLEVLTLLEPFGAYGVVYRREDYPQPWYDETDAARAYPLYAVLHALLRGGSPELRHADSADPERVVAMAQQAGGGTALWLANITATPQTVRLHGVPEGARATVLDSDTFVSAVTGPEGFWQREVRPLDGDTLRLTGYAVARIAC